MAEKKLSDLIDEITARYNEHYRTSYTSAQLEPVIRFQWSKIYEALLVQDQNAFIKLQNFGHIKLRPIKALRRQRRLKKETAKTPQENKETFKHRNRWGEINRLTNLIRDWIAVKKQKDKHYKKYFLKHPKANPITFPIKIDLTRYESKKTVEAKKENMGGMVISETPIYREKEG